MKRFLALFLAIASLAPACPVLAQPVPGTGSEGPAVSPRSMRNAALSSFLLIRMYNPKTITTVKGSVLSLETVPPQSKDPGAMRSTVLKMEKGEITVLLGPDWYLAEQKISLKAGDQLEMTGSKVTLAGKPTILASDLKVSAKSITLRNNRGFPLWLKGQPGNRPVK
jgi:hypothetical protein